LIPTLMEDPNVRSDLFGGEDDPTPNSDPIIKSRHISDDGETKQAIAPNPDRTPPDPIHINTTPVGHITIVPKDGEATQAFTTLVGQDTVVHKHGEATQVSTGQVAVVHKDGEATQAFTTLVGQVTFPLVVNPEQQEYLPPGCALHLVFDPGGLVRHILCNQAPRCGYLKQMKIYGELVDVVVLDNGLCCSPFGQMGSDWPCLHAILFWFGDTSDIPDAYVPTDKWGVTEKEKEVSQATQSPSLEATQFPCLEDIFFCFVCLCDIS
jgi:hypothetical protein